MSNINDRVAFLKGLAEGMKLSDETNEGKLLLKMLDVLESMAEEITSLRTDYDEMQEYVESIDDDLADMEEYLFDEENEDGYDDDEDEDEDDDVITYNCPHCGNEVTFEVDGFDFEEENLCPACGKPLFPADEDEDTDKE
ncbi:MAG: AraC family transcriptional regulator [Clostridia bacterium]|nr:AraC family transcriptional regulator [Clostridia bacterium]